MPKMLDNCLYDKIKLLHKLSCTVWFIEQHAKADAQKQGDTECQKIFEEMSETLNKYVTTLKEMVCKCGCK